MDVLATNMTNLRSIQTVYAENHLAKYVHSN